ncbi:MAG: hypothetical protein AAFX50_20515 [Acidobacteriota bacterium]
MSVGPRRSWAIAAAMLLASTAVAAEPEKVAAETPRSEKPAAEPGDVIFRGEYTWKVDGHRNRVEAVFSPRGGDLYDVAFHFDYARRTDMTYRGQAQGELGAGTVRGQVKGPNGHWRYAFEAEAEDGRLDGRHFDIWGGKRELFGTLSLERAASGEEK